jgi:hypothetical protein
LHLLNEGASRLDQIATVAQVGLYLRLAPASLARPFFLEI